MSVALAVLLGIASYAFLLYVLGSMVWRVVVTLPMFAPLKKLRERLTMLYHTVRYEDDDEGLWQIIEDREGNRYRVLIRDDKGEMKW